MKERWTIHKVSSSRWTKRLINNNEENERLVNRSANGNFCIQTLITPQSHCEIIKSSKNRCSKVCKGKWWTRRLMSRALRHCFAHELHCGNLHENVFRCYEPIESGQLIFELRCHKEVALGSGETLCSPLRSKFLIIVCFYGAQLSARAVS